MDLYGLSTGINQVNSMTDEEIRNNYSIQRHNEQVRTDLSDRLVKIKEEGELGDIKDAGQGLMGGISVQGALKRYGEAKDKAQKIKDEYDKIQAAKPQNIRDAKDIKEGNFFARDGNHFNIGDTRTPIQQLGGDLPTEHMSSSQNVVPSENVVPSVPDEPEPPPSERQTTSIYREKKAPSESISQPSESESFRSTGAPSETESLRKPSNYGISRGAPLGDLKGNVSTPIGAAEEPPPTTFADAGIKKSYPLTEMGRWQRNNDLSGAFGHSFERDPNVMNQNRQAINEMTMNRTDKPGSFDEWKGKLTKGEPISTPVAAPRGDEGFIPVPKEDFNEQQFENMKIPAFKPKALFDSDELALEAMKESDPGGDAIKEAARVAQARKDKLAAIIARTNLGSSEADISETGVKALPQQALKPLAATADEDVGLVSKISRAAAPIEAQEEVEQAPPTQPKPPTEEPTRTPSISGEVEEPPSRAVVDFKQVAKEGTTLTEDAKALGSRAAGFISGAAGVGGSVVSLTEGIESQYASFKNPNHHGFWGDLAGDNAGEKIGNIGGEIGSTMDIIGAATGQPEIALAGSVVSLIGTGIKDIGNWFHHKDDATKATAASKKQIETPDAVAPLAATGGIAEGGMSTLRAISAGGA
tara:strand:- start:2889 stop:4817 length:1929 start_codon:yes stop_codon:yes gene_type:complete